MSEKPILFSAPMVKAILAGGKTMTRRVLPEAYGCGRPYGVEEMPGEGLYGLYASDQGWFPLKLPYQVGDILGIRENFRFVDEGSHGAIRYEADGTLVLMAEVPAGDDDPHAWWDNGFRKHGTKLRPGIFLPQFAWRPLGSVTGVKAERVQDISEEDVIAEGTPTGFFRTWSGVIKNGESPAPSREDFEALWNSINGKRPGCSWEDNPWVGAYTFSRVEEVKRG